MSDIKTSTIDSLNDQKYNYGTIPNEAVVEQNQTYFAYFDNVTPTRPTIIDQTAYQIKYLIDTEGNPINPEPDTVTNRPQAIALYNLNNNFEPDKNAIVKLIENDPLYVFNPYNDALSGKHPITHTGKIIPLVTTEYGQLNEEYITTMSFQPYKAYILNDNLPDFSFLAYPATIVSQSFNVTTLPQASFYHSGLPLDCGVVASNALNYYNPITSIYTFGDDLTPYGIQAQFEMATSFTYQYISPINGARVSVSNFCAIEYSTDGGANWDNLPIFEPLAGPGDDRIDINNIQGVGYNLTSNGSTPTTILYYTKILTYPRSFNTGDQVRGKWSTRIYVWDNTLDLPDAGVLTISLNNTATPPTQFALRLQSGIINNITASYFDSISSPPTSPLPVTSQYLTASLAFSNYINNDYLQIINNEDQITFGYIQPTTPINILPGDKIRCEHTPNQVATILEVTQVNETPSRKCFTIYPPIIPDGATLDHFTIYRVTNDGSSIILNVPPPQPGTVFSGIIQPEFISKELVDKYDKIILNLTEREIIN
jgi:hypothetical protein